MLTAHPLDSGSVLSGLNCGGHWLDLQQPRIMGVLNVTPDSFSDRGRFGSHCAALNQARAMLAQGAHIIDVGGQSTRPGSEPVSVDEELKRVVPVVEQLCVDSAVIVSIDTGKPEVMRAAVAAGARMINDVNALRSPGALEAAADTGAAICLMHMQGKPATMQRQPYYDDVVAQVRGFLQERATAAQARGVPADKIVLDPGFGFGKTLEHNTRLFANLAALGDLGCPVMVGVSRKTMLAGQARREPEQRLPAGLAAAALAVWLGASIIRTHDVWQTADAIAMAALVARYRING